MQDEQNLNKTYGGDSPKQKKKWIPWLLIVLLILLGLFFYRHQKKKEAAMAAGPVEESVKHETTLRQEESQTELKLASELFWNKEYEDAKVHLELAVKEGNAEAMAILGSMYVLGQGVTRDGPKGMEMLNEAERSGSAFAKSIFGYWHTHGREGLEKSAKRGLELIQEAIDTGKYYGYVAKARLYEEGAGVEKDHDKAVEYLEEAKVRGYEAAEMEIERITQKPNYETTAELFASEYSIPQDMEEKYVGHKVRLTGKVKSTEAHKILTSVMNIELDTEGNPYTIVCETRADQKSIAETLVRGDTITIQGIGHGHKDKIIHLVDCWFPGK